MSRAMRTAMMAMTTSSSIKVKPSRRRGTRRGPMAVALLEQNDHEMRRSVKTGRGATRASGGYPSRRTWTVRFVERSEGQRVPRVWDTTKVCCKRGATRGQEETGSDGAVASRFGCARPVRGGPKEYGRG